MSEIPQKTFLTRAEAANYLDARGLPCSPKTLAKLACLGGGPEFRKFGRNSIYTIDALDAWIEAKFVRSEAMTRGRLRQRRNGGGGR